MRRSEWDDWAEKADAKIAALTEERDELLKLNGKEAWEHHKKMMEELIIAQDRLLLKITALEDTHMERVIERDRYKAALENIRAMYMCFANPIRMEITGIVNKALSGK